MFCAFTTFFTTLFSDTVSPVERDRRVGLCRAVEFHKITLKNRLRLHCKIDKREIYKKKIETQIHPITGLVSEVEEGLEGDCKSNIPLVAFSPQ